MVVFTTELVYFKHYAWDLKNCSKATNYLIVSSGDVQIGFIEYGKGCRRFGKKWRAYPDSFFNKSKTFSTKEEAVKWISSRK